jgi:SET domain-containing protein
MSYKYDMRFFCICLLSLVSSVAYAGIYQCVGSSGIVEFRDKPCQTSLEEETFLPIRFFRTDHKKSDEEEKKEKRQSKNQDKKLAAKKMREERKEASVKKNLQNKKIKEELKTKNRKLRCQKLDDKLKIIDEQLRQGTNIKRFKRLQLEKDRCQKMKVRYCSNGPM